MPRGTAREQSIDRARDAASGPIEHVHVNHVAMAEELLDRADVVAVFQEVLANEWRKV